MDTADADDRREGAGGVRVGTAPTGCDIRLLAGRAAFLPDSRSLLLADLHLGKAATFRSAGIPVPEGSAQADLGRLGRLVRATDAVRVVILGDLLHAAAGCTPAVVEEFRSLRAALPGVSFLLVVGNHDGQARRLASSLGLDACVDRLDEPPLCLVHDAAGAGAAPGLVVAGHLHPRVAVRAPSGDRIVDRCFHLADGVLTLPAFGSFTGGHPIPCPPGTRAWIAGDDAVVEVTRFLGRAGGLSRRPRRRAPREGGRPDRAR